MSPMPNPAEILRQHFTYLQGDIRTATPGVFESYDPATGKASVKPSLKRVYEDGAVAETPVISNVPVHWPRSGAGGLACRIARGDPCLIVFAERSLEEWADAGGEVEPGAPRMHDLNDAIAIPGLYPFGAGPLDPQNRDVLLKAGQAQLAFDEGKGELTALDTRVADATGAGLHAAGGKVALGAGGVELLALVTQLLLDLSTSLTMPPGQPIQNASAYATLAAELAAITGTLA